MASSSQIAAPPTPPLVSADAVIHGPLMPAIERIRVLSPSQWTDFVLEWATGLQAGYVEIQRCDGAGDMGRDVIGVLADGSWHNFQCKYYDHPLHPGDVWCELGKLFHYVNVGEFPLPTAYSFVAPRGAGTKLVNLLRRPNDLKAELLAKWDSECRRKISSVREVPLDEGLKQLITSVDFAMFRSIPPLDLISVHAGTRWHVVRFGGGFPARKPAVPPPSAIDSTEVTYVSELLRAYSDHLGSSIRDVKDLDRHPKIGEHFNDSRIEFYSAEQLKAFSRDNLPDGYFESLQDEIHFGIRDELRDSHVDAYRKVQAVVAVARRLQVTGHPLSSGMRIHDRGGICHQLVNERKFRWTP